jgi:hypothetical protein
MVEKLGGLARLMELMPPPPQPAQSEGDPVDWQAVEKQWGTGFPSDYVEFVNNYVDGSVENYLSIGSPNEGPRNRVFAPRADVLEKTKSPWPAWPEPGGLIAWGGNSSGDSVFWRTSPDPEQWTIVVWRRQQVPAWVEFHVGIVEFLLRTLAGDLSPFSARIDEPRPDGTFRFLRWQQEYDLYRKKKDPWA